MSPLDKFREHENKWKHEIKPMIMSFLASPPSDAKDFDKEYRRLNEILTVTCVTNDAFDFKSNEQGRQEKRDLTKDALQISSMLDQLKEAEVKGVRHNRDA